MLKYSDFLGAVFDVDDTLLDNNPPGQVGGLHEMSRLAAAHAVGRKHNIPALVAFGGQDNLDAWHNSPVHTLEGAVWTMLQMTGVADVAAEINFDHPLLREIVKLKDELHESVLLEKGRPVPGAEQFVRALASHGFAGKLAVASTAVRRDVLLSLQVVHLADLFPDSHIISKEQFFDHPKPHPMAFELGFQSLGLPADTPREKVLAFEDHPRGIMSAKAAGLFTCAITTGFSREHLAGLEVPPDIIGNSFAELATMLQLPFQA